jgi:cobalamin biosynthesis protein CobD/CbiB
MEAWDSQHSITPLLQHSILPVMENKQKSKLQLIWGILLLVAGIGIFFRIPQIMPEIKKIEHFTPYIIFIYFCFYLIGVLLVVGGGRKVYTYLKSRN